ncbi:MAG: hypothetical protein M1546_23395, partial [Chloroflexi bacterium]|nr:hypothetical protein [Chloroflexota bacterium]
MQSSNEIGFKVSYLCVFFLMLLNMLLVMLPLTIALFGLIIWILRQDLRMLLPFGVLLLLFTPFGAALAAFLSSLKPH